MKSGQWRKYLDEQRASHGKTLYTVTELANVAGVGGVALNVQLTRLRRQEVLVQFAHGLYGPPGAVSLQELVAAIDARAYITGHYALYAQGLVTQRPVAVTCFTDHRRRQRVRETAIGRLTFVCLQSGVYSFPPVGISASPAQSLCDYVYLSRRRRTAAESLVTFRNLDRIDLAVLQRILVRYSQRVREHVERLVALR